MLRRFCVCVGDVEVCELERQSGVVLYFLLALGILMMGFTLAGLDVKASHCRFWT